MSVIYRIDDNRGGKTRVWWLNKQGYTVGRFFDTHESAKRWIDFMESLEASTGIGEY